MPLVEPSSYRHPRWLVSGHLQTILPALFRRIRSSCQPQRLRLETPDDDFLDVDCWRHGNRGLAVLSHGLEGSSRASYIRGTAAMLVLDGWDVAAWNFRGCSGEINRRPRFYHSGETGDLTTVLGSLGKEYDSVALIGFSLGGNMTLKYLGESPERVHPKVKAAVAFSVPCDLAASARRLDQPVNRIYTRRFLRSLKRKVIEKERQYPGVLDIADLDRVRSFADFDNRYTAPLHGFRDADDYWARSSCRPFLKNIRVPALLVNARNDPFLPPECFPVGEAERNPYFYLEVPASGGHVGFSGAGAWFWSEVRAAAFLKQVMEGSGAAREA